MLDSQGFDLWAGDYDRTVAASDEEDAYPFAGYRRLMNLVYRTVMARGPGRVLDVGLGTGLLAARLYEAGFAVTGLDFSRDMLRRAQEKMPGARLMAWDFACGLPEALLGERFDVVVSTYALHHLTDPQKVALIPALLGLLRGDGLVLIGDVGFRDRDSLEACRRASGDLWDEEEHYMVFSELRAALAGVCAAAYQQVSHCAGLVSLRRDVEGEA
ncbi:MAG: class I SAM-dependent methyltransferase [Oscillospiraceae bacterium]|jgi:putative AdoMet-dependent methyltransferase|nr:class I SAM-dependent methyltransferase [Oscillospiraceae bacterium]